ncbi:MAG: DEAD/DEAH box helicase [Verrucomicrobiaceae bacterium]|nr:DEAD/DEAH box helicase [Verrucomicrobiaceae bacterium]
MQTARSKPLIELRPYQHAAIEAITHGFQDYQKQLATKPTGAGKTVVFASLAAHYQPKHALILAHREELIDQAVDKIMRTTGLEADVEMASSKASLHAPVVVASVQTLMREQRRSRWPRDHFGLIVVDEAHHTLADSYLGTLRYFDQNAFVLGVTATPDRSDKRTLSAYYENVAFEITLLDLIKQGYLSPIQVKTVPLRINLDGVRTVAGDYSADDLGHALDPYLEEIARLLATEHRHRKLLVFLPLISCSRKFAAFCRDYGLAAEHVDGGSPDRKEILERFSSGETTLLSNAMLLTEGYDEPSIDCVVCLRPTKIRSLYSQIVGRGTRLHPGKDHLLLLDFLWLSERHSLIKPAHLIAADDHEADAITEALGADGDLEQAQAAANADRTRKLVEQLQQNRTRNSRTFDAMEFAVTLNDPSLAEFVPTMGWHSDPVTAKQSQLLAKFGLNPASVLMKGHAAALLDRIFMRLDLKLATAKQVRWLRKLGHPKPELASFNEASEFLDTRFTPKTTHP